VDEKGFCENRWKEWDRLYHENGTQVGASYRRLDKRYDRLYKKHGLSEVMKEGISLQPLAE
jgi:hypothetical protein